MTDIIIIGAGTAGMTAAIYARRAAKTVIVFEGMSYGGQIINTPEIENYPAIAGISGFDYATKLYEQCSALGAEIRFEKVTALEDKGAVKAVTTPNGTYEAKAVIIATGSENRKLGVEREDALVGKGISYCATCDGGFYRGKKVAVVGGGNTALEDALYLADIASDVYLIHRRDTFRGEQATVDSLSARENVHFVLCSRVTALVGDPRLEGIEVTDNEGNVQVIQVSGLFVAVGRIPNNREFAQLIPLDEGGYVAAGEDCTTPVPGIFAAGDNRSKAVRQLVTAAADGAVAATQAIAYINLGS